MKSYEIHLLIVKKKSNLRFRTIRTTDNPNDAVELVRKIDKLTKRSKSNILTLARKSISEIQK